MMSLRLGNAVALSKRSGMSTEPPAPAFRPDLRVRRMLDPVGVVDRAVDDGIGVGGVADQRVPPIDGRLVAGDDGGRRQ